jgi:hypothetical protein
MAGFVLRQGHPSASRPQRAPGVGPETEVRRRTSRPRDDADCRVHALAALVRPVHVFQVEQQGQSVDHQCVCRAVGDGHGRVAPPLLCPAQAYRSDRREQCDTPSGTTTSRATSTPGPVWRRAWSAMATLSSRLGRGRPVAELLREFLQQRRLLSGRGVDASPLEAG